MHKQLPEVQEYIRKFKIENIIADMIVDICKLGGIEYHFCLEDDSTADDCENSFALSLYIYLPKGMTMDPVYTAVRNHDRQLALLGIDFHIWEGAR